VTYRSDESEGPTAGSETADPLEFLARVLVHIPDKGHVTTRRWAALLRQIFEVDPLVCPRCAGPMRIVACITQAAVIDQILTHLRTRAATGAQPGARSPPAIAASVGRGARRRPTASTAPLHAP